MKTIHPVTLVPIVLLISLCSGCGWLLEACGIPTPRKVTAENDAARRKRCITCRVMDDRLILSGFWTSPRSLDFSPDGRLLAVTEGMISSLYDYGELRIWDIEAKKTVFRQDSRIQGEAAFFMPDGKHLIIAGFGKTALIEVGAWRLVRSFEEAPLNANKIALSPDGKTLAVYSFGVHLFDTSTGRETRLLKVDKGLASIAFSPNGRLLAGGGIDGKIHIWDTATWKKHLLNLPVRSKEGGDPEIIRTLRFSPDSTVLATKTYGFELRDVATGEVLHTLYEPNSADAMAFSPDGRILATVGDIICLWDVSTGQKALSIQPKEHEGGILTVAFSPDGKTLATGGNDDKSVILWDVSKWKKEGG